MSNSKFIQTKESVTNSKAYKSTSLKKEIVESVAEETPIALIYNECGAKYWLNILSSIYIEDNITIFPKKKEPDLPDICKYYNRNYKFMQKHNINFIKNHNGFYEKSHIKWYSIDDIKSNRHLFRKWYNKTIISKIIKLHDKILKKINSK